MELTEDIVNEINEIFADNLEMKKKLFDMDRETIIELGLNGNKKFTAEDIIDCYENNNLDYLYKEALKRKKLSVLYFKLIGERKNISQKTLKKTIKSK